MRPARRVHSVSLIALLTIFFLFFTVPMVSAAKDKEEGKPLRSITLMPEYTGVVVQQGKEVRMDLTVINGGRTDEDVNLKVTKIPEGWKAKVKTYNFTVTGVGVKRDDSRTLTFLAEPDKDIKPGTYVFRVKAETADGRLKQEKSIAVKVKPKLEEKEKKGETEDFVITTSYPVLRGASDAKFEFSLEVENKLDKEMVVNLSAKGPTDWDINFKPAYEEKYISSLRLKERQNSSFALVVDPPRYAEAGEYPITVNVSAGDLEAEAKLMVVLTGTYKIDAATTTGLLSLSTQRGKPANISMYVKNTGTAKNHDISFVSFQPEKWKVQFKPEKIEMLPPGELQQVEVTITPDDEALVGDYSVAINVKGEKADDNVELRVGVKAPTVWGWIGIAVILFVIAGLCVLFIVLGRR